MLNLKVYYIIFFVALNLGAVTWDSMMACGITQREMAEKYILRARYNPRQGNYIAPIDRFGAKAFWHVRELQLKRIDQMFKITRDHHEREILEKSIAEAAKVSAAQAESDKLSESKLSSDNVVSNENMPFASSDVVEQVALLVIQVVPVEQATQVTERAKVGEVESDGNQVTNVLPCSDGPDGYEEEEEEEEFDDDNIYYECKRSAPRKVVEAPLVASHVRGKKIKIQSHVPVKLVPIVNRANLCRNYPHYACAIDMVLYGCRQFSGPVDPAWAVSSDAPSPELYEIYNSFARALQYTELLLKKAEEEQKKAEEENRQLIKREKEESRQRKKAREEEKQRKLKEEENKQKVQAEKASAAARQAVRSKSPGCTML